MTDDELIAEVSRRGLSPRCRCGGWRTYLGAYDQDGMTWRRHGCLRAIDKCRCG
jgi:hypothetical protein